MRASPPLQVTVQRYGAWRVAVATLAATGLACWVAWWAMRDAASGAAALAATACLIAAQAWLVFSLTRLPERGLRWDGRVWWLGPPASDEAVPGQLKVSLDLGSWMLLRFEPEAGARWWAANWLPVQRRGLESRWHALRCSVYASPSQPASRDAAPGI